ncbi:MAG: glycosyltransferase family 1 protein [Legionellales bacterium]
MQGSKRSALINLDNYYEQQRVIYIYVEHTVNWPGNTGIQRVVRKLSKALVELGEPVRFVRWEDTLKKVILISMAQRENLACWGGPAIQEHEQEIYHKNNIPALQKSNWFIIPEVTHLTVHAKPVTANLIQWAKSTGFKVGFIFHDAIPIKLAAYQDKALEHSQYMRDLLLADMIWPNSQWSAQDLLSYWKQNGKENAALPQINTCLLSGESSLTQRVKTHNPSKKIILSVGAIEPRKNQTTLIKAFQAYQQKNPDTDWQLLLIGHLHPLIKDEVEKATTNSSIKYLGHLPDEKLNALYNSCAFTVYPSTEEGFGLPILESLWYGKPCICANFGAMEEVAQQGGCLRINTWDKIELEQAIAHLIENESYRLQLTQEALTRPIATWQDYASAIKKSMNTFDTKSNDLNLIYYWIENTAQFSKNTGIQRVCRQLAKAMMESGLRLIPVTGFQEQLIPASLEALEHFSQWHGPSAHSWHPWIPPTLLQKNSWFMMTELLLYMPDAQRRKLLNFVHSHGLRSMGIFHDATPYKLHSIYPEFYPRYLSDAHCEYMVGLADYDLILAISDFSKTDLVNVLNNHLLNKQQNAKVITALLPGEFPAAPRVMQKTIKSTTTCKIVTLCTIEPRKNHKYLLEAFMRAKENSKINLELIIIGRPTDPNLTGLIQKFILQNPEISWEKNADDARVHQLLKECDFTIYPSIEEGFGLPILESLWHGKPCICANFGAMLEVAQAGGCLLINMHDMQTLADTIVQLAENTQLQQQLSQEALSLSFKTWKQYAQEVSQHMLEVNCSEVT